CTHVPSSDELRVSFEAFSVAISRAAAKTPIYKQVPRIGRQLFRGCERALDFACVVFKISLIDCDESFLGIDTGLKHSFEMERRKPQAPGIGQRVSHLFANYQQRWMRQRDDALFEGAAAGCYAE